MFPNLITGCISLGSTSLLSGEGMAVTASTDWLIHTDQAVHFVGSHKYVTPTQSSM